MKIFQIFSFLILLFEIQTQVNINNTNNKPLNDIKPQNNSVQINQTNTVPNNNTKQKELISPKLSNKNDNNTSNKSNPNKLGSQKEIKLNTTNKTQKEEKQVKNQKEKDNKEDIKNKLSEGIIKEDKDKPFNLTESLINFFKETFGSKENKSHNETEEEKQRRKIEEETQKKLKEERDKKRKEEQAKLEKIQKEENIKKEKEEKYLQERLEFMKILSNNTFEEVLQINLLKGEKETLYLDLEAFTKIKLAIMVTDSDSKEKINFFFSGPNSRGRTASIYQLYNKNYLFWEYETLRKGEFLAEITNKGSKENEIYFLLNQQGDKKKDRIDTEKLDKISLLLNEIDNNVNQLRNKKKIEIKQVNSHNDKVTENNKWIVIYSGIEIFTMIMIFCFQSCYISDIVNKV